MITSIWLRGRRLICIIERDEQVLEKSSGVSRSHALLFHELICCLYTRSVFVCSSLTNGKIAFISTKNFYMVGNYNISITFCIYINQSHRFQTGPPLYFFLIVCRALILIFAFLFPLTFQLFKYAPIMKRQAGR